MNKIVIRMSVIMALIVVALACAAIGSLFGMGKTAQDLQAFWFDVFGLLGTWVAGIGAITAAVVALAIADRQRKHTVLDETVRNLNHSITIVQDMRSRADYLSRIITEGGRPLSALIVNCDMLMMRYEALYDRELYTRMHGSIIDKVASLSGSLAGIHALIKTTADGFENKLSHMLTPLPEPATYQANFANLSRELGELLDALYLERKALDQ